MLIQYTNITLPIATVVLSKKVGEFMTVTFYSYPKCGTCQKAKKFFPAKGGLAQDLLLW